MFLNCWILFFIEENDLTSIVRPTPETAKILYKPSMKDQGDTGIKGRFLVQYDVEHPPLGDLLVREFFL